MHPCTIFCDYVTLWSAHVLINALCKASEKLVSLVFNLSLAHEFMHSHIILYCATCVKV